MTATYEVQYFGRCLGDLVANGAKLTVDPSLSLAPGDMAAVVLWGEIDSPYGELINTLGSGGYAGMCKIFLGQTATGDADGEPIYLIGQTNPPLVSPVPRNAIAVMHKVVDATAYQPGNTGERDTVALRLIARFFADAAEPIGEGFRQ